MPVRGEVLEAPAADDEVWAHPVVRPVLPVAPGAQELRIVIEQQPAVVQPVESGRSEVSPAKRLVAYALGLAAAVLIVVTLMAGPPWQQQAAHHHRHSTPDLVNPSR